MWEIGPAWLEQGGGWTPVTEGLPEPGWYLVTYNEGTVEDDIEKMCWVDDAWWWGAGEKLCNQSFVLAWAPLPQTWKERGK